MPCLCCQENTGSGRKGEERAKKLNAGPWGWQGEEGQEEEGESRWHVGCRDDGEKWKRGRRKKRQGTGPEIGWEW